MTAGRCATLGLTLVVGASAGCGPVDQVASVGGDSATFGQFATFVSERAGADWEVLEERVLVELFRQFLDERLLARWARDEVALLEDEQPLEGVARLLAQPVDVGEEDVRRFLSTQPNRLSRPERIELGQILITDREAAERLRREILGAEDFERLGRELAEGSGVVFGGYREMTRADLPVAFRDLLFALAVGQISEVVEADYGFHIFHVAARRPAETLPWEAVATEVAAELRTAAAKSRQGDMLAHARARYRVEIFERNLPFSWSVGEQDEPDP